MRFRTLSYFRDYEDDDVRADEYEGTLAHRPVGGLRIRKVDTGEEIQTNYQFESSAKEEEIFIYCFSTEFSKELAAEFEAEACVEIDNVAKLLGRLRAALVRRPKIRDKTIKHGAVHYYLPEEPPIADWALPERIALRKPVRLSRQKEYRIAFAVNGAFAVENVNVRLANLDNRRKPKGLSHPEMNMKLGNLSKFCVIRGL